MRDLIGWLNQVVEFPSDFTIDDSGRRTADGKVIQTLTPQPGEVIQEGTPIDDENLDSMDESAWEALQIAKANINFSRQNRDRIEAMEGEVVRVTLSNTQQYPFNNSQTTVPLSKETHKTNYTVLVEVISSTGGGVGDVRITDRAVNGFKISYSGAATSVTLDCYIRGGY